MVKIATTTWKNIYKLRQSSGLVVHVSEKYYEDDKEYDENDDEEDIEIEDVNVDDEKEE